MFKCPILLSGLGSPLRFDQFNRRFERREFTIPTSSLVSVGLIRRCPIIQIIPILWVYRLDLLNSEQRTAAHVPEAAPWITFCESLSFSCEKAPNDDRMHNRAVPF